MTKAWRSGGACAMPLLWLAACANNTIPAPAQPEFGRWGVMVAAEHSGSSIELGREQELVVRLQTTANSPFQWSLVDFTAGALAAPAAPKFEREWRPTELNDGSGAEVWRFKPAAPGSATLRFEYRRARALEPNPRTVSYTVTVR